jgi:hypothetical protein
MFKNKSLDRYSKSFKEYGEFVIDLKITKIL